MPSSMSSSSSRSSAKRRHPSHAEGCGVCLENSGEKALPHGIVWENDLWLLRHCPPPTGTIGWLTLQAKRHVAGPAYFDDLEAASFGPTLRHITKTQQSLLGPSCLRVYIAAMGESHPHFHCHLVPRYEGGLAGWAVFGQNAEAAAGRITVDEAAISPLVASLKELLADYNSSSGSNSSTSGTNATSSGSRSSSNSARGITPEEAAELATKARDAILRGDCDAAIRYIDAGAGFNARTPEGTEESLLLLASYQGKLDRVSLRLIEKGAEVNVHRENGETPLMWACRDGRESLALKLIEMDANVNAQTEEIGVTPLIELGDKSEKIRTALLARGAIEL